jgi:lysophospholipase L1-like esterase
MNPPINKALRRAPTLLCSLVFLSSAGLVRAQTVTAAKTNRWESDMRAFEALDRKSPPPTNAVLFTGASNIRLWKNLGEAFPGHKVFNRGFGGAEMADLVEFAGRVVIPYRPRIVIIYAGDNDLADHKTPERVLADFQAFAQEVHSALPASVIGCIAIKPSPSRARLVAQVRQTDGLLESFCRTNANTIYIDDLTPMSSATGGPRPELFGKDGLHLNQQGRAIWTSLIRPILDRYDPASNKTPL